MKKRKGLWDSVRQGFTPAVSVNTEARSLFSLSLEGCWGFGYKIGKHTRLWKAREVGRKAQAWVTRKRGKFYSIAPTESD